MQGRIYELEAGNIFYNLALEHAILHQHSQTEFSCTIRFWRTPRAVVLGRSQDIDQEINIPYCKRNEIVIARRISGGGTVYTDQGNLNISIFIKRKNFNQKVFNYQSITETFSNILIKALSSQYPIESFEILNSSSVVFQNKKISGSAGYIHKEWILHHLTLLYAANLKDMNASLRAGKSDYLSDRPSKFHPTTNLPFLSLDQFKSEFIAVLTRKFAIDFVSNSLTERERSLAQLLHDRMYSQESWILHKKRTLVENSFRLNID
jgi:lipoate-protein ligase A